MPSLADSDREYYLGIVGRTEPCPLSNADLEREFYLQSVTNPDSKLSNADLKRMYYMQSMGLTEPYNGSISDIKIQKDSRTNLLTANQANGTDTLGTTEGLYTTATHWSSSSSIEQAAYGSRSWKLTRTTTNALDSFQPAPVTGAIGWAPAVTSGETITVTVAHRAGVGSTSCQFRFRRYDAVGNTINVTNGPIFTPTNVWKTETWTLTVGPNAFYGVPEVLSAQIGTIGDSIYLDKWGIWKGSGGQWAMPGEPIKDSQNINLLSANQATATDALGTTVGFGTGTGVLSSDTTWSVQGSRALKFVIGNVSYPWIHMGAGYNKSVSVNAGTTYTCHAVVNTGDLSGINLTALGMSIDFADSAGVAVGTTANGIRTNNADSTVTLTYTSVAPAGAVTMGFRVLILSAAAIIGQYFTVDKLGIWEGTSTKWTMPPPVLNTAVWRVDASKTTPTSYNLLTDNQASIEIDVSGFTGWNATVARTTSLASHGSASIAVTSTITGLCGVIVGTLGAIKVVPGQVYTVKVGAQYTVGARTVVNIGFTFYNSSLVSVGQSSGPYPTLTPGVWTTLMHTAVAPANADSMRFEVYLSATGGAIGDVLVVDQLGVWAGTGGDWAMPGTPIQNLTPDRLVDLSGNGRDAIFGAATAAPVVLPYTGENYIRSTAGTVNIVRSPSIDFKIGDIYEADFKIIDTTTANPTAHLLLAENGHSARIQMNYEAGRGWGYLSANYPKATTGQAISTTVYFPGSPRLVDGQRYKVSVTFGPTSTTAVINGVSYPGTVNVEPIMDNTSVNTVITATLWPMDVYSARVIRGGVPLVDMNLSNVSADYATITNTGSAGGNWTITRAASGFKTAVVDRPLLLFGGAQNAIATAAANAPSSSYTHLVLARTFGTHSNSLLTAIGLPGQRGAVTMHADPSREIIVYGDNTVSWSSDLVINTNIAGQAIVGGVATPTRVYDGLGHQDIVITRPVPTVLGWMAGDKFSIGYDSSAGTGHYEFIAAAIWDKALTDDQIAEASAALLKYTP